MRKKTFFDFIRVLNECRVEYCIIGAEAVTHYVRPRYSKDIDILLSTGVKNSKKMLESVKKFFGEDLGLTADDFKEKNQIIQFGFEPNRIDIITGIDSLSPEENREIMKNRIPGKLGKEETYFASLDDMIKLKKAAVQSETPRAVDIEDLKLLESKKLEEDKKQG